MEIKFSEVNINKKIEEVMSKEEIVMIDLHLKIESYKRILKISLSRKFVKKSIMIIPYNGTRLAQVEPIRESFYRSSDTH